jgi:asparagine synthase (glutamine-hydrolysing)
VCGIAGVFDPAGEHSRDELVGLAGRMGGALVHRGPDGSGVWVDERAGLALSHRRLAVVDLTQHGAQPMMSQDERWVTVYNGEVYNHRDLRRDLESEGVSFRGHSDTEVLLEAVARWGVQRAFDATEGMFAIALWDRAEKRLALLRDRMGEKPLHLGRVGRAVVFASELGAISALPGFDGEIDVEAVADLMRWSCIPAPRTIFSSVQKLPPGHIATVDMDRRVVTAPWWDLRAVAERGLGTPVTDESEALQRLEEAVRRSVSEQLLADVPVGCFLSGGVDSSLVAALAQESTGTALRTFSVGFEDAAFDEAPYARSVAEHLGTSHAEHYLSTSDVLGLVPDLARTYDEPFADSSQLPVLLVSRFARSEVTVALTGDGGDELFAGYLRYLAHGRLSRVVDTVPLSLRRVAARALTAVPAHRWTAAGTQLAPLLPARARVSGLGPKVLKAARVLSQPGVGDVYDSVMSQPQLGVTPAPARAARALPAGADAVRQLQFLDQLSYLPDDLLVKTDRAAMSVSLETRIPLLSRRVVELSWSLPIGLLVRSGRGKWPLRELLYRRVPRELVDRPKQGFGVPLDHWLRGPLKQWASDLLYDPGLPLGELIDADAARHLLDEHCAGRVDAASRLWPVLMLQGWRRNLKS